MTMLARIVALAVLGSVMAGAGGAFAETRKIVTLPGDRCPEYNKASAQVAAAFAMLSVISMMNSRSTCNEGGRETLAALDRMMRYGRNPSCFASDYWYRGYQPWARKYEQEIRSDVRDWVKKACDRVREQQEQQQRQEQQVQEQQRQNTRITQCRDAIATAEGGYGRSSNAEPEVAVRIWAEGPPHLLCTDFPEAAHTDEMARFWRDRLKFVSQQRCDNAIKNADQTYGTSSNAEPSAALRAWTEGPAARSCLEFPKQTQHVEEMRSLWREKLASQERIRQAPNPFKSPQRTSGQPKNPFRSDCGALVGERIPAQCVSGPIGKDCSCLPVSNTCPYTIQVTFRLSGISGTSSMPVRKNSTNRTDACTSRPGQTIEYIGWKKQ